MTVRTDDPHRVLWPERVAYSNGMLLDEADFSVEQAYHRGRMALLNRYLHGSGTVVGLDVVFDEAESQTVMIAPGLGIDRIGRVIESPLPLCLRLDRWFEDRLEENPSSLQVRAGSRSRPDHILADIFIGFRECEIAKRPSFTRGDFDALGAVAPLRLRDATEATLVARTGDNPPLPTSGVPELEDRSRPALDEFKRSAGWIEDRLWQGADGALERGPEHTVDTNPADIFLARLTIPAIDGDSPAINSAIPPTADSSQRRMIYTVADLMALRGL